MSFKRNAHQNGSYINAGDHPVPLKKRRLDLDLFNTVLLDELVVKIFSHLGYKDLLLRAALVCKRWDHLSKDEDLWKNLYICCKSDPATEIVEKLLERSKGIKSISFTQNSLIGDSVLSKIVEQKNLRTLDLGRCRLLKSKESMCGNSGSIASLLLSPCVALLGSIANCRSLQKLNLCNLPLTDNALRLIAESCTNLKELDISHCYLVSTDGLLPVIQHCTQMKILQIVGCIRVKDDFLIALAAKPSQIETLHIGRCKFTPDGLKYTRKLPKLKDIDLNGVRSMSDSLVSIFSNLIGLGLDNIEDISNDGVSTIVRNNPNLKSFGLSGRNSVDDIALEIISKSSCRLTLEVLVLTNCPISEFGVIRILQNCAKLRFISFSNISEETLNNWRTEYQHIRFRNHGA